MAKKKTTLTGTLNPIEEATAMPEQVDTGRPLTDVETNLANAQAKYRPGSLTAFQKVMQGISQRVYAQKQNTDMGAISGYINPTQVSGGNFSNIMGWLEQERGKPISEIYSSTMKAYMTSQEMLQNDIQNLRTMKYNIQNNIQQFKLDLIKNAPGVYESLSNKDKKSIEVGMPSKSVYALMDEFTKDVYDRQKKMEDLEFQWKKEEHELRMRNDDPAQQRKDLITNLRGAVQTLAQKRQATTMKKSVGASLSGGLVSDEVKEDIRGASIYNDLNDAWTVFWNVMEASPTADPLYVQSVIAKTLTPNDRVLFDISEKVSSGIDAMEESRRELEKMYGGKAEDVFKGIQQGKIPSSMGNLYVDSLWKSWGF